jgi:hypothetical protein
MKRKERPQVFDSDHKKTPKKGFSGFIGLCQIQKRFKKPSAESFWRASSILDLLTVLVIQDRSPGWAG